VRHALRSTSCRIKMSAFTPTRKSAFLEADSGTDVWKERHTRSPSCSIKLPPRPDRESNRGIVLDPAQGKLADVPVQREAIELRLGRIR
jgi:hypothetical protein